MRRKERTKLNVLLVLEGEALRKFNEVSKEKGISTAKDLFMHLLYDEYDEIIEKRSRELQVVQ